MKEHNKEEQPYMSEKLVIFNRIYKEYNEIYHDAASSPTSAVQLLSRNKP